MFDGHWRGHFEAGLKPIGNSLKRAGVSADAITGVGIVMAVGATIAIGLGSLQLGLLLLILTGVPDMLDGAVAKASGQSSSRGAFFDSVSDRLTDGLLFGGFAYFLAASGEPPWVVMIPVAGYVTASLVSYIRAKAEALGFDARGGLVERAERFILLALALLFNQFMIAILMVIVVLNFATAIQRFVKVWNQATHTVPRREARPRRRPRRSSRPISERWQERTALRERQRRMRNR